jgi:eukaryotic-like serine/threonine-protein kinase
VTEGALDPGTVLLGKYRIESVLGRGGMGVVLRVTHLDLGESLAIKVLSPEGEANPELIARFLREARAVVRLRGEHVAKVTDVGVLPHGRPFMVMEYLRGVDLADELKRRRHLAPGEAVDYLLQVCEALAEAHAHGIVHRDIKPANLFLTTRPDGTPLVKVLDFGISKAPVSASEPVTKTDIVMGTAGYMSPEQMKAAKDVDGRSDIWALGVVLYECLSGRRPFEGGSFSAVVVKASTEPPAPMDGRAPRALQAIVMRCLEKDRGARFATVAELATALAPFARDQRAAATIVDRANLIRQRPGSSNELPPFVDLSSEPQVDEAPEAAQPRAPRRYGRAAVVVGFGAIALVAVTALICSGGTHGSAEHAAGEAGSAGAGRSEPATGSSQDAELRSVATKVVATTGVAPTAPDTKPTAAPLAGDDKRTPLMVCADLEEQKHWRELAQCTTVLEAHGFKDQANAFRDKASAELLNEAIDGNVRQKLRRGELRSAQVALKEMTADSVYRKPLSDAFDQADARNVENADRKVKAFASAQDCGGMRRYLAELTGSVAGTERAIAAVKQAVASCAEQPAPPGNGSQ